MLLGGRGDDTFAFGPEPNGEDVIRDVVITGSGEADSIHVTLENYLVDHEMSDLGSDDFLFSQVSHFASGSVYLYSNSSVSSHVATFGIIKRT